MNSITNFRRFYAALKLITKGDAQERDEYKDSLVRQYTNGRTTSLKEITWREYNAMCTALEKLTGQSVIANTLKKKRSTCLHQMQLAGIDTTSWPRINSFCMDERIAGKPFRELSIDELEAVTTKIRIIVRKDANSLEGVTKTKAKIININNN